MSKLKIKLDKNTLDKHGWIFSPKLGIMIREHELGNGKWDVEVDHYKQVNFKNEPPIWAPDTHCSYPPYKTFLEVLADNQDIAAANDWVDGDEVEFE